MQIVDAILFWANTRPRHPAILQPGGGRTYRMLADTIEAAAVHFSAAALDPDRPVAIAINDPAKMLAASLGMLHAGFSILPAGQGLLESLSATGASTLVADRGGLVWPDHEIIYFDHAWTSTSRHRGGMRPATGSASPPGAHPIFFT